jgi:hypothetical protein
MPHMLQLPAPSVEPFPQHSFFLNNPEKPCNAIPLPATFKIALKVAGIKKALELHPPALFYLLNRVRVYWPLPVAAAWVLMATFSVRPP